MKTLDSVSKKVYAGTRLTEDDAMTLFSSPDLVTLANLANFKNQQVNSLDVFYNVNRHINPTNVCVLSCKFCAFSRKPGQAGAYAYSIDEMLAKAKQAVDQGATEVHMVGGLHPRWTFDYYLEMIRSIKQTYPDLHIKAFTAVELDWFVKKTRSDLQNILERLMEAGLGSLPGGGAEIFHPEIRDQICDTKVSADQWIQTHELAHGLGLKSNATMLYGHIENTMHRVDHMRRLRELQDRTGGFNAFIPLSFQPHDNDMGINRFTFGVDDLKTVAVARLYLDNFRNVKTYWVMSGQDISQLALSYGANDIDGTVTDEKISHMAGGRSGLAMSREGISQLIENANRRPVERDTLYNPKSFPSLLPEFDSKKLREIMVDWQNRDLMSNADIAYLLKHADLNMISAWSAHIRPIQVKPNLNEKPDDCYELEFDHLEISNTIWETIGALINEARTSLERNLSLSFPNEFSPTDMLKVISFVRAYTMADLHIDFFAIPTLSPLRTGLAQNQDPRFKTFILCAAYGVSYLTYAKEKDSLLERLLEDEICVLMPEITHNHLRVPQPEPISLI